MKIYKDIPNFSKYQISEDGEVISLVRSNRVVATGYNWAGYAVVTLTDDSGFRSPRKVHRLVYSSYVGELKPKMVIDHIDNNKLNNHYCNLSQITPSENSIKSFISGGNKDAVVWSNELVHDICKSMETSIDNASICKSCNIELNELTVRFLNSLRRKETHTHISTMYNITSGISSLNKKDRVLNVCDVEFIYIALNCDITPAYLAKMYRVTHSTICKIRDKITWVTVTDIIDELV